MSRALIKNKNTADNYEEGWIIFNHDRGVGVVSTPYFESNITRPGYRNIRGFLYMAEKTLLRTCSTNLSDKSEHFYAFVLIYIFYH